MCELRADTRILEQGLARAKKAIDRFARRFLPRHPTPGRDRRPSFGGFESRNDGPEETEKLCRGY